MIHLVLKSWSDRWKSVLAWTLILLVMGSMQISVYPSIAKSSANTQQFLDSLPEAFQKIFRMQDYTSGAGYLSAELFSVILPLIIIAIATTWGAAATAEEEERGTADLLFALPWNRRRLVIAKIIAGLGVLMLLGVVIVAMIGVGASVVDMQLSISHLIAATSILLLLGAVFAGISLLAGALTGRKSAGNGAAAGIAVLALILYSLGGLVDTFNFTKVLNPLEWAVGSNALFDGLNLVAVAKLTLLATALMVAAVMIVERKDISA